MLKSFNWNCVTITNLILHSMTYLNFKFKMVEHGYTWQASKINLANLINVRDAFLRYC